MLLQKLKLPIIVLLLVAVSFMAVKGLMYWNVKQALDDLINQAEIEDIMISYSSIETDIKGSVVVKGIYIKSLDGSQTSSIDHVHMASNDSLAFMLGDWKTDKGTLPDQLVLSVSNLNIGLSDEMLSNLRKQMEQQAMITGRPAKAACEGGLGLEDPQFFADMGFKSFSIDIDASYFFDVEYESLQAEVTLDIKDIETVEMSVELGGVIPQDFGDDRGFPSATLVRAGSSVDVKPEFGNRVLDLCAARKKQSVDQFRNEMLVILFSELDQAGVQLGAGLSTAMKSFYRDWGEMRVSISPEEPIGMLSLMAIKPDNFSDVLGFNVHINEERVEDTSFKFVLPTEEIEEDLSNRTPKGSQRVRIIRRYQLTPVSSISQQIGKEVRVSPKSQPVRWGKLVSVTGGDAVIERHTNGGIVATYVKINEIEKLEVQKAIRQKLYE